MIVCDHCCGRVINSDNECSTSTDTFFSLYWSKLFNYSMIIKLLCVPLHYNRSSNMLLWSLDTIYLQVSPLSHSLSTTLNSFVKEYPSHQLVPKQSKLTFQVNCNVINHVNYYTNLIAFSTSGTYTVVPKFNHEEKPAFPCFDIRILSPLEALKLSVLPSSIKSAADHPGSVAAILAYLIKTESSDTQENVDIVDEILLSSVQKIGVPFSDISTFLAGIYYLYISCV